MSMGAAIAALAQWRKGVAGFEQGKYNAAVAKQNARIAEADGAAEQAAIRREARAAMGSAIAQQGASGIQLGTGSALDILNESALNAELNAMSARRVATIRGQGLRAEAKMYRRSATQALIGGAIGAGSEIYSGIDAERRASGAAAGGAG